MKKFGKKGIFAAALLTATLSVSALTPTTVHAASTVTVPTGFEKEEIEVKGKNEALNGWNYYFYNDKDADGKERDWAYDSENLHVLATTEGKTGNALHLKRDKADGELVMYSYAFDVKPDQNYVIGAYLKSICLQSANNKVYFKVKEQSDNGTVVGDENEVRLTVNGRYDNWTERTFSYKTSTSAKTLILRICAEGVGDFYVDDITVKESNAGINSENYGIMFLANGEAAKTEDPADMPLLTGANISSDSSDGDGKSLRLNHYDVFKTTFGMLPHGKNYKLSFKYKNIGGGKADRLSIRLDNVTLEGKREWYAPKVESKAGVKDDEWKDYEYEFTAVTGQTNITWMGITAYGGYLIDKLSITSTDDSMQYLVNGSFSGAYTEGYNLESNSNIANQADGSGIISVTNEAAGSTNGHRGFFKLNTDNLTKGNTYTLSFDYRSYTVDSSVEAGNIFYGTYWKDYVSLQHLPVTNGTWSHKDIEFTAGQEVTVNGEVTETGEAKKNIANTFFMYGPNSGSSTYYKNVKILDSNGNDCLGNSTFVAPEVVLGENVFPYGTFDGNTEYVAEDWTFTGNGNVYGLNFDTRWEPDAKPDWKICLYGSEETPATATSKEITVNKRTLAVNMKTYTGRVKVSVLAGETEIEADENDFFELPEGTTTVKLKFTATEYVAFKYVTLGTHTHAEAADDKITTKAATCTNIGGRYYHCDDCDKNVYLEKTPMLAHEFEHIHEDASCKNGVDKDVCKNCHGEFNVTVIPATGEHVYEEVIINEATCTAPGMKQDKCKICGAAGNTTVIPKKDHDYKNGKCTVCQAEDPDYVAPSNTKKSGCSSNVYGELGLFGILGAAALVIAKRKKG